MAPALFKSRRSSAPVDETSKVAEAVWAYYEAGRRPATTPLATQHEVVEVDQSADDAAEVVEVVEVVETDEVVSTDERSGLDEAIVTASGQTLEELAAELEALIDSIRYGTDPA